MDNHMDYCGDKKQEYDEHPPVVAEPIDIKQEPVDEDMPTGMIPLLDIQHHCDDIDPCENNRKQLKGMYVIFNVSDGWDN